MSWHAARGEWRVLKMKLILVVDDDLDTLVLFETQLGSLGHRVMTCETPEDGLKLARTGNPDLVILDVNMPRLDGIEVLRLLRAGAVTRETPVMIITGVDHRQRVMEAMQLGIADYLLKPYTTEQLHEKLNSCFSWNIIGRIRTEDEAPLKVERRDGRAIVTLFDNLTVPDVRQALTQTLTPEFFQGLGLDPLVIDLRPIPGMSSVEVPVLKQALAGAGGAERVHVVAGRNFGELLSGADSGLEFTLYLSFGDMELNLKHRRAAVTGRESDA